MKSIPVKKKELVFIISLLILSALLMPIRSVSLGDAASNNLAYALSLLERGEPLFYRRGPVYYGLIAISFKLFGVSVEHAVWVTRLFVPLNIALVYMITRSMLNPGIAVVASTLVFFSYPLNLEASKLEVDNVLPFFMLLALWLSWLAAKRQSMGLALASGFALGVGWLVKEAAMLFLPMFFVPFMFRKYRNRKTLPLACLSLAAFAVTLLPWFSYALSKGNSVTALLGAASPQATAERFSSSSTSYLNYIANCFLLDAPVNLFNYFQDYFRPNFAIWLPLLLGLFYAFVSACRQRSLELAYLLGGIILFSPIAIYQGGFGERLGQCYIIFLILYILLAFALDDVSQILTKHFSRLQGNLPLITVILVAPLLLFEFVNPLNGFRRSTLLLWTISDTRPMVISCLLKQLPAEPLGKALDAIGVPQPYLDRWKEFVEENQSTSGFILGERFDESIQDAADWMLRNIPVGTKIMVDGHLTESVPFYTRFKYQIASFDTKIGYTTVEDRLSSNYADMGRLLGVVTYHGFRNRSVARYRGIYLYFEGLILGRINDFDPKYVFVFKSISARRRYTDFYEGYFRVQTGLTNVFENHRAAIFRVDWPLEPLDESDSFFYQNSSFLDDMMWLKANIPEEYKKASDMLNTLGVVINE